MKCKRTLLMCAICGLLAAIAVGPAAGWPAMGPPSSALVRTAFTWDDGAPADQRWMSEDNWDRDSGYPDGANDNADFPSGAWTVDLVGAWKTIRNLTIEGSVDFEGYSRALNPTRITARSLLIAPTQGDVEITASGTAEIVVE